MNIVTITLNPAFDVHCFAEHFAPYHENLATVTAREAGGKGVNISRALSANGVPSTALVVLGDENADDFLRALVCPAMDVREIRVPGRIRENITIHTTASPETRISFPGFATDDTLLPSVKTALGDVIDKETVVAFTGRVPNGITLTAVKEMLLDMQKQGAKLVIDSKSFSIDDLIDCHPFLIKPNEEEIVAYADHKVNSLETAALAAQALRAQGIENVMISLGEKGAVLATRDGCFAANAPYVDVRSTIGAGDSTIGGFLAAMKDGCSYADMLKTAVCYGSAACMTEGTEPPQPKDVTTLLAKTIIRQL